MGPLIEFYDFGRIEIDGKSYTNDVIICPDRILPNWLRKSGHSLEPEDLSHVISQDPQTIIIGTGKPGMLKVPEKTKEWIENKGIELVVLPTSEACQKYNKTSQQGKVIAGLHLTC